MQYDVLTKTIRDVAASVKHTGKLTVFAGAGISKAADIPSAGEIVQRLAHDLFSRAGQPASVDLEKWLQRQLFYDNKNPYGSLLDAAYPNRIERSKFFQSLIAGKSPTKAHLAIAELMKKGMVNGVLTTNFDSLMEDAIVQKCNRAPCTVLFDTLPEFLRKDSLRPKVLKLHGDYLFGNIQNLGRELSLVQNSMREKLRLYAYAETLVIAGYSGGDNSVMQVIEELAADPAAFPGGIFWLFRRNSTPSNRVMHLLEKTSAKGSGRVSISDCDSFFTELLSLLDTSAQHTLKPLVNDAYKVNITKDERLNFVKDNLEQNEATEFTLLLQRKPALEEFANTPMFLDYLIARYEEDAEIPANIGELIDRYVNLLDRSFKFKQVAGLDTGRNSLLRYSLAASKLKNDGLDLDNIEKYINDDELYRILCMYVGLFEDATDIISAAFNKVKLLGDLPAFVSYGRRRPWSDQFYKVAQLIGCSAYVDRQLIERICDYLLLEFDKEHWFPDHAIATLASMDKPIITQLLEYMHDPLQDTFSREDAAKVLGRIGNRRIIKAIADMSDNVTTSREAKMLVYALGETGNPHALNAIKSLAPKISFQSELVLKNALSAIGYSDEPVSSGLHTEEPSLRVEVDINEILDEFDPDVKLDTMTMSMLEYVGTTLAHENKLWEAEGIFIKCLERYPTIARSYHHLALLYSRQSRLLAAKRYYALGLTFNPDYSDYFNDFGNLMRQLKNYEAAHFLYVKAIARDKEWKNHRPWFNLANLYLIEAVDDSGVIYKTNLAEDAPYFYYTYDITWDASKPPDVGRLLDAKTCLRWVLTLQPAHRRAKELLNRLDLIVSDTADKTPDSSELFMALHAYELRRPSAITWPSGVPEDIKDKVQKAGEYYKKADFKKAFEYLLEAWEQWPKLSTIASSLAIVCMQLNERPKAIDILKEAIAMLPHQDVDLYINLSENLLKEKRVAEAANIADEAVQIAPNDPLTWYTLGSALAASGKKGEAVNAYQQSIRFSKPWSSLDAIARDAITDLPDENIDMLRE